MKVLIIGGGGREHVGTDASGAASGPLLADAWILGSRHLVDVIASGVAFGSRLWQGVNASQVAIERWSDAP